MSCTAWEVYLFGSEAAGTAGKNSDVDFAVAGLPPAAFYHVVDLLSGVLRRPLDLVDLDEPTPSLLDTFSPLLLKVAAAPPDAIEIAALAGASRKRPGASGL